MLGSHCWVPSLWHQWLYSKMENVVLEERHYERAVKGYVFDFYRRTKRDMLFGGMLEEEKGGVF